MFVNLSSVSLMEAAKFIDTEFSKVNVLQVTFLSPSIIDNSFAVDLFTLVKSRCILMLLQESADDYLKCTFVFHGNPFSFYRFLKLKTKLLITKLGKEVFINV